MACVAVVSGRCFVLQGVLMTCSQADMRDRSYRCLVPSDKFTGRLLCATGWVEALLEHDDIQLLSVAEHIT